MPKARENVGNQVVIGFRFASDWLRQWREFFWVNHRATERSKAEPMQSRMTFVRSKLVNTDYWLLGGRRRILYFNRGNEQGFIKILRKNRFIEVYNKSTRT